MYVKFTRLDGSAIWINAAFVVTVEPRKLGGSVVVPIGDGLDYDVRETPEQVLKMLEGAPEVTVVPVPPPKGLAPTPADVSPEPEEKPMPEPAPAAAEHKTARGRSRAKAAPADGETKPARKPRSRAAKKVAESAAMEPAPAAEPPPAPASPAEPAASTAPAVAPGVVFGDEQVERLRRMAPRSLKKLSNTLVSQFRIKDPEYVIRELAARGVLFVEQDHVNWR